MSKGTKSIKPDSSPAIGYASGYIVFDYNISRVEGKLLTLIEGLGLRDSQEKAIKDLTRDIVQSLYRETEYVYGEAIQAAFEKQHEITLGGTVGMGSTPPNYTPAF